MQHTCNSQCDSCHTMEHCQEADGGRVGDLLLCRRCLADYRADPEGWVENWIFEGYQHNRNLHG